MTEMIKQVQIGIKDDNLIQALKKLEPHIDKFETSFVLNTIQVKSKEIGIVELTATNGNTLLSLKLDADVKDNFEFLLPLKSVKQLLKALPKPMGSVSVLTLDLDQEVLSVKPGNGFATLVGITQVENKTSTVNYPKWECLIPDYTSGKKEAIRGVSLDLTVLESWVKALKASGKPYLRLLMDMTLCRTGEDTLKPIIVTFGDAKEDLSDIALCMPVKIER